MYDPVSLLEQVDQNWLLFYGCIAGSSVFNVICYYWALKLAATQKTYVFPLWGLAFMVNHDLTYVAYFDKWFNEYDHLILKFFWFGLVGTAVTGLLFLKHFIQYGHQRLMPFVSRGTFALLTIGAMILTMGIWLVVKSAINDEFFFIAFALTIVWIGPSLSLTMLTRQSQEGVNIPLIISIPGMQFFFGIALYLVDPYFRSPVFVSLIVISVLWSVANVQIWMRLPPWTDPAESR